MPQVQPALSFSIEGGGKQVQKIHVCAAGGQMITCLFSGSCCSNSGSAMSNDSRNGSNKALLQLKEMMMPRLKLHWRSRRLARLLRHRALASRQAARELPCPAPVSQQGSLNCVALVTIHMS